MRYSFAIVTFVIFTGVANAEEIPKELHNSIHSLMATSQVLKDAKNDCHKQKYFPSAESLVKGDPDYFLGMKPGARKWPKVLALYKEYSLRSCDYLRANRLSRLYTKELLSKYAISEAKELEKLLKSAAGRKYMDSSLYANRKMQKDIYDSLNKHYPELSHWFTVELRKLQKE